MADVEEAGKLRELVVANETFNELNELVVDDEAVLLGELMVALSGCQCNN